MKDTRVKEENFICIQGWMLTKLNLKGNDLLVYAIIYGYSQDGSSWFSGSLQYLADWVNGTKRGIQKNLNSLESKGLIKKTSDVVNGIHVIKYKYIPEVLLDCEQKTEESDPVAEKNNCDVEIPDQKRNKNELDKGIEQSSIGGEQSSTGYRTEFHGGVEQSSMGIEQSYMGGEQSSINNIDIINQKIDAKDTPMEDKPSRAELIRSIVDQWNRLEDYGIRPVRRLSPDSIRCGMLNARINEYSYEDVIQAIENIKRSSFLQANNDRGWKIDFEWFVKPNNFCKVWEGKYIDEQKGVKDNDSSRGYSGEYNSANTGQAGRKYNPNDFLGNQWKEN